MLRFCQKFSARPASMRPSAHPSLEILSERITPSISPVTNGNLAITGTGGRDVVTVFMDSSNNNQLTVLENGHSHVISNGSSVSHITFTGMAGNDLFINTTNIAVTAF